MVYYSLVDSPVGKLLVAGSGTTLQRLSFIENRDWKQEVEEHWQYSVQAMEPIKHQLQEYFVGDRKQFDVELDFGETDSSFSAKVWQALSQIPYGETRSYKDIAHAIGHKQSYRAVGQANHRNPIAIVIPCHRVIGSNGKLTGFGGGLDVKQHLLEHERSNLN